MNTRPLFCMDTHAIYWRRIGSSRLSATADQVFEDAIQDKAILVVPYVIPEMHDRLIALAGKRLGATIVTKDEHLCASQQLTCLW